MLLYIRLASSINSSVIVMRSHFLLACCIDNNKGKCTLFPCVSLCVGLQTRDLVSLSLWLQRFLAKVTPLGGEDDEKVFFF